MKCVLNMGNIKARQFFLKPDSYTTIDLPPYFDFEKIITTISKKLENKDYKSFYKNGDKPGNYNDVNYKIYKNKNGKYDWRPLELIHPFLYVALVNLITEEENWLIIKNKFKEFQKNSKIECCSLPNESKSKKGDKKANILNWINKIEQKSIKLALNYKYMATTDISNCYGSIYTHTIAWALHGEIDAKNDRKEKKLLGSKIDSIFQEMNYSQTNGIPQGSIVTDFIAELILGYADQLLDEKLESLNISDYKILRFRDDYRIFANDELTISVILKQLTQVLLHLNLKVNDKKTKITTDIIANSMKEDKYEYLGVGYIKSLSIEKQLLIIKQIGDKYPNSSRQKALLSNLYEKKIKNIKNSPKKHEQLTSILVDIMINNPKNINICIALISEISKSLTKKAKVNLIGNIRNKFKEIPNTEYLSIWLQRLIISVEKDYNFDETICKKVIEPDVLIWNSTWLNYNINESNIINQTERNNLGYCITLEEVDSFNNELY